MEESGTNCSRPILKFENGMDPRVSFVEPMKHVITLRGQILVSRTGGDFFFFSFVLSSFLRSCVWCGRGEGERGRVYVQNAPRVYVRNVPV